MKSYFITLMAVALLNGMIGMISPEGNVKKYIRLLGGLCLLCAMAQPIVSILSGGDFSVEEWLDLPEMQETVDYDEIYNHALVSGGEKNAETAIKNRILSRFELPSDSMDIEVNFVTNKDELSLGDVRVTLRDQAIFADPREIISYVNESWNCPCTVIYD